MDFIDRLIDKINSLGNLKELQKGYLSVGDSFVIYPLPGSRSETEFYDGVKDVTMNYEIAMKSQDGNLIEQTLWQVSDYLDSIQTITSSNQSFDFNSLTITSKPFINQIDEQGWLVFIIDFQVNLTTYTNKEEQ